MENREIVLKQDIINAFKNVGLEKGQTVIVHTSLSSLGFVCGGAQIVIEALLETVGPEGTIIMPTQSWKNLDPSTGVHWEEPEEWHALSDKIGLLTIKILHQQTQWAQLQKCLENGQEL